MKFRLYILLACVVVGARKNGLACLPRARPFSLSPTTSKRLLSYSTVLLWSLSPSTSIPFYLKTDLFFFLRFQKNSCLLRCVFESSLPFHTKAHWWEYAHNGIQHLDVIVIKNLRFHPRTRIQQIGIFKNLHSVENFWKDAFSLNAVFTG